MLYCREKRISSGSSETKSSAKHQDFSKTADLTLASGYLSYLLLLVVSLNTYVYPPFKKKSITRSSAVAVIADRTAYDVRYTD